MTHLDTLKAMMPRVRITTRDDLFVCLMAGEEDALNAAIAAMEAGDKHDCELWRMEGIGCADCNPIARDMREDGRLARVRAEVEALTAHRYPPAFDTEMISRAAVLALLDRDD